MAIAISGRSLAPYKDIRNLNIPPTKISGILIAFFSWRSLKCQNSPFQEIRKIISTLLIYPEDHQLLQRYPEFQHPTYWDIWNVNRVLPRSLECLKSPCTDKRKLISTLLSYPESYPVLIRRFSKHSRITALPWTELYTCEHLHYNLIIVVAQLLLLLALCCTFFPSVILPEIKLLAWQCCDIPLLF